MCAAIDALAPLVVGLDVDEVSPTSGGSRGRSTGDSQLRWIGPEKGAIHMADAALVNAAWDLRAKREEMPLWRLLAGMTPGGARRRRRLPLHHRRDHAGGGGGAAAQRAADPARERIAELEATGYPAYTTSAGWLGYDDEKIRALCREAVAAGSTPSR